MRLQDPIRIALFCLLTACGSSSGGGGGGGASSDGGGSTAPSFTPGSNVIGQEDTATSHSWATDIQNGTLFELTPENPSLFSSGPTMNGFGELSFIPTEDTFGGTDVTVILRGAGGQATAPISFRIDVSPVNDPPSFEIGPDAAIEAGSGSHFFSHWATNFSAGPDNESSQELAVVIESNTNPDLFQVSPIVDSSNGNLYFSVVDAVAGEATITLHVVDDGGVSGLGADNSSESASFTITVTDTERPTAEILYPPDGAKTDASTVCVRGTAHDAVGIDFVRVNGLHADTDDGFSTWVYESFPAGPSASMTIQLSDVSGNFEPDADSVTVHGGQPLPLHPLSITYDSSHGRLIFFSKSYGALLSYDPSAGITEVFSEPTEELPWDISDLVYRNSPPSLYAVDDQLNCVLSFDLDTGEASVVSGNGVGEGPALHSLRGITTVQGGGGSPSFIAVIDASFGPEGVPALVSISSPNGTRAAISANAPDGVSAGAGTGSGPEFGTPAGVIYQHSLSRFLLVDSSERALFSVDRDTGDRTILVESDDSTDGSFLGFPSELLQNSNGSTTWVLDPAAKKVFAVDMATNSFSLLSSNNSGFSTDGHRWTSPRDFTRIAGSGLVVSDFTGCSLFSVETSSGGRTRTLDYSAGTGPSWSEPTSVEIDDEAGELLLSCANDGAIYSVSLEDGSRELVTGPEVGTGPSLLEPQSVAALNAHTLIVTDTGAGQPRVLSVHRVSGNRTLVSGQGVGGGVSFNDADSLAVDPDTNSAFVLDAFDETITRVSLSSGGRFRVAGGGVGAGPPLDAPISLAWDQAGLRVIVLQAEEVLAIDPISLNRSVLANLSDAGFIAHATSRISCPPGEAHALVTLPTPLSVIEVSLVTGGASTFVDMTNTMGPPITDMLDVATSAIRKTAYVLSLDSNALYAMDSSGTGHVLFSRD